MDESPLLYSLREHRELIFRCLEIVAPSRVVEIGSEAGGFTREMVDWAEPRGAKFIAVEPIPVDEVRELARRSEAFELVEGRSPEALHGLEPAEVYVIDGDHNHWTVTGELRAVYRDGLAPLAILHDTGWPCARRDQYYSPQRVPGEARLPYSYDLGRAPDEPELVRGGFSGAGQFAVATAEGGAGNGVLTAVEDFRAERPDLEYAHVPAVFGLGVLYARDAPYAPALRESLAPWDGNELLERMERNRVALYARVLALQEELGKLDSGRNRMLMHYAERLGELESQNSALRLERGRLLAQLDAQAAEAPAAHGRG